MNSVYFLPSTILHSCIYVNMSSFSFCLESFFENRSHPDSQYDQHQFDSGEEHAAEGDEEEGRPDESGHGRVTSGFVDFDVVLLELAATVLPVLLTAGVGHSALVEHLVVPSDGLGHSFERLAQRLEEAPSLRFRQRVPVRVHVRPAALKPLLHSVPQSAITKTHFYLFFTLL